MKTRLALALLLLHAGLAAAEDTERPTPPTPEERAARYRAECLANIPKTIRYHHLDPARVDGPAICDRVVALYRTGVPRKQVNDAFSAEIRKITHAFATPGAAHDRSARYRFPFEVYMPRLLSQTSGGETHNTPEDYHAFDFLMPVGTKILAARAGTVVAVADGTPDGVPWQEDGGNVVRVLHDDGTWASYVHLSAGIPVKPGQAVKRGDLLAYSGNTGFSRTPHLHLVVQRLDLAGEVHAVPIRFGPPGQPGQTLEAGRHYGQMPRTKRELRVFVDGERVRPDQPIPIGYGARPGVKVELVGVDGAARDVTTDPRSRYETMTVWNVHSPALGEIVVEAVPDIDMQYIEKALPLLNQSEGLVFVYHGLPWEPDFGFAQVAFQVLPAAP